MIKAFLFDWGNTLMIDYEDQKGPMYQWDKIVAIKNADICLSILSKKLPCYIATNAKDSSKEDIYNALNLVDIGKYITDIYCYREIGHEKPTTDFYKKVFNKLYLVPDEIVLVGDDIEKDYYGALRNGIHGILFDPNRKFPEIERRIGDLLELQKYL
jgi:FMN phosphatase YigB (HAD superfamily)